MKPRGDFTTSNSRKKQKARRRRSTPLAASAHPVSSNLPPLSSGDEQQPSAVPEEEANPLDIHQRLLAHLDSSSRAPITSVFQLAHTITTFCVDTFDPHRVPEDYQFFDFFERSIGNVVSAQTWKKSQGRTLNRLTTPVGASETSALDNCNASDPPESRYSREDLTNWTQHFTILTQETI